VDGRVAVTGASGFVGRHLTRHASASGFEVVGAVRSEAAARAVVEAGGRPAAVPRLDAAALAAVFEGARAVVHLAQIGAERGGATYEAVNVGGTRAVAEAARAAGVARVVSFSGLGVAHYGMKRRCTNRYFLSKLAAEVELFRSDREVVVFRPSYIVGTGDVFVPAALEAMAAGEVERPGDGLYRMQPIAVADAAALVLAAIERSIEPGSPAVFDLVGSEPVSYRELLDRLARLARGRGHALDHRVREVPVEEAERQARSGGYHGMDADELDCLLCDEVSDARPLEELLGRSLTPLDDALAAALPRP
jgi:NADH dehydrogenase